jgi:hypothetical protein
MRSEKVKLPIDSYISDKVTADCRLLIEKLPAD